MTDTNIPSAPAVVNCPHCGKPVPWTDASAWKPFCSKRCRLIDLGDWLTERHAIPGDTDEAITKEDSQD